MSPVATPQSEVRSESEPAVIALPNITLDDTEGTHATSNREPEAELAEDRERIKALEDEVAKQAKRASDLEDRNAWLEERVKTLEHDNAKLEGVIEFLDRPSKRSRTQDTADGNAGSAAGAPAGAAPFKFEANPESTFRVDGELVGYDLDPDDLAEFTARTKEASGQKVTTAGVTPLVETVVSRLAKTRGGARDPALARAVDVAYVASIVVKAFQGEELVTLEKIPQRSLAVPGGVTEALRTRGDALTAIGSALKYSKNPTVPADGEAWQATLRSYVAPKPDCHRVSQCLVVGRAIAREGTLCHLVARSVEELMAMMPRMTDDLPATCTDSEMVAYATADQFNELTTVLALKGLMLERARVSGRPGGKLTSLPPTTEAWLAEMGRIVAEAKERAANWGAVDAYAAAAAEQLKLQKPDEPWLQKRVHPPLSAEAVRRFLQQGKVTVGSKRSNPGKVVEGLGGIRSKKERSWSAEVDTALWVDRKALFPIPRSADGKDPQEALFPKAVGPGEAAVLLAAWARGYKDQKAWSNSVVPPNVLEYAKLLDAPPPPPGAGWVPKLAEKKDGAKGPPKAVWVQGR